MKSRKEVVKSAQGCAPPHQLVTGRGEVRVNADPPGAKNREKSRGGEGEPDDEGADGSSGDNITG